LRNPVASCPTISELGVGEAAVSRNHARFGSEKVHGTAEIESAQGGRTWPNPAQTIQHEHGAALGIRRIISE
jgi:hypothetical protein